MPCTATHAFFALDVLEKLDNNIINNLQKNMEDFKTFSQGPDVLFFYNSINLKESSRIKTFGRFVHKNNSQDFFINLVKYIKSNNYSNNHDIMAFLYGYICHYILDSTCHPFIFYKTGVYRKNKETLKYNSLHNDMETFIDAYIIHAKKGIEPRKFKVHDFALNTKKFSKELSDVIDNVFYKTFKEENLSKKYITSIKNMHLLYKLVRYDRFGIKKKIYSFLDMIKPKKILKFKQLSYAMNYKNKMHYLNLEKNKWNHPLYENEIYDYSFVELYIISIHKAAETINKVNDFIYNNKKVNLKKLFTNASYVTGKDCNIKTKMKFFEF